MGADERPRPQPHLLAAFAPVAWALAAFAGLVLAFLFVPDALLRQQALGPRWLRIWLATGWAAAALAAAGYLGWRATRPATAREDPS